MPSYYQISKRKFHEIAIRDHLGTKITFADLETLSRAITRQFSLDTLPPRSVIALQLPNHACWVPVLLAIWENNHIAVPVEPSLPAPRAAQLFHSVGAYGCIHQSQTTPPQSDSDTNLIKKLQWTAISASASSPSAPTPRPDTILIKLTSGTTGFPGQYEFSSAQLQTDCVQICQTMGITPNDLNFAAIPLGHSYGFSNIVLPLLLFGVPLYLTDEILPLSVLQDLEKSQATVFPGNPTLFRSLLALPENKQLPSSLRLFISAGAPLPPDLQDRFHARFGYKIHSFYGASECGGIAYDASECLNLPPGFVGQPMHGVKTTLSSLENGPTDASSFFELTLFSDAVCSGPLGKTDYPGSFQPSDILEKIKFPAPGFRIAGRRSEIINIAGRKVSPIVIETVLQQLEGIEQVVVFSIPSASSRNEDIIAAIVSTHDIPRKTLLQHCQAHLAPYEIPRHFWSVPQIQVDNRGKINRQSLAQKFQNEHA